MAALDQGISLGTVTRVHKKGFAFAQLPNGEDVFIPQNVHEALGHPERGTKVSFKARRTEKGLVAQISSVASLVRWGSWQIGATQVILRDTRPGSHHPVDFACFKCGTTVLQSDNIYKIKQGSIWTNHLMSSISFGKSFHNPNKGVPGHCAHCTNCAFNIGSIYLERYKSAEAEKSFPCAKLTLLRERMADDSLLSHVVLVSASRSEAELAVSRFILLADLPSSKGVVQVRTTQRTFELLRDKEIMCAQMQAAEALLARKTADLERVLSGLSITPTNTTKPWKTRETRFADGVIKYEITREALQSGEDSREQEEFNFACGQMLRLGDGMRVRQVDVYESPFVKTMYESKKERMPSSRELWVFHGSAAIEAIMTEGFKVGGRDYGISVRNGALHGHGVYTATGPKTPMQYAHIGGSGNVVILSKALEGTRGAQEISDCWAPHDDWLIFKTGEQLLPKYVVYY
jgi:cold shock CspA family protein